MDVKLVCPSAFVKLQTISSSISNKFLPKFQLINAELKCTTTDVPETPSLMITNCSCRLNTEYQRLWKHCDDTINYSSNRINSAIVKLNACTEKFDKNSENKTFSKKIGEIKGEIRTMGTFGNFCEQKTNFQTLHRPFQIRFGATAQT